ncbi:hypothetical protein ACEUZ9_001019 [Paracoccus litorisediminis]|uniref:hypothetical protein n=1 Tax=Paracoccus litorisediminis TaxID=2006130 RepID=UPI003731E8C8
MILLCKDCLPGYRSGDAVSPHQGTTPARSSFQAAVAYIPAPIAGLGAGRSRLSRSARISKNFAGPIVVLLRQGPLPLQIFATPEAPDKETCEGSGAFHGGILDA